MPGNLRYQHKRTSIPNKRPLADDVLIGEVAVNTQETQPSIYFKDDLGSVIKIGNTWVGETPPIIPGSGFQSYTDGELWYDETTGSLKIYDKGNDEWLECFTGSRVTQSATPPLDPVPGDFWYNLESADLYIYDDGADKWVNLAPDSQGAIVEVSDTEPPGPYNGNVWFDNTTGFLYVYNASVPEWSLVTGGSDAAILNIPYADTWDGDIENGPSRNAVYDIFNGATVEANPTWDLGENTEIIFEEDSKLEFESGSMILGDAIANLTLESGSTLDTSQADDVLVPERTLVNGGEFTLNAASQAWVYQHLPIGIMNGRMSNVSNQPYSTMDNTVESDNLYYMPYQGFTTWLYNNSETRWEPYRLDTQIVKNITGLTVKRIHDVYLYDNSGNLDLELLPFTNDTTRGTSLALQDGVWVKSGEPHRRWLGTIIPITGNKLIAHRGAYSVNGGGFTQGISNYYNRLPYTLHNYSSSSQSMSLWPTEVFFHAGFFTYNPDERFDDIYIEFILKFNASVNGQRLLSRVRYRDSSDTIYASGVIADGFTNAGIGIYHTMPMDIHYHNRFVQVCISGGNTIGSDTLASSYMKVFGKY